MGVHIEAETLLSSCAARAETAPFSVHKLSSCVAEKHIDYVVERKMDRVRCRPHFLCFPRPSQTVS